MIVHSPFGHDFNASGFRIILLYIIIYIIIYIIYINIINNISVSCPLSFIVVSRIFVFIFLILPNHCNFPDVI